MIKGYASSSKGNLFEVNDGQTRLMLECGLPLKQIQRLIGFSTTGFQGCLVTHEHMDHAKAARALADRGMDVYATPGTLDALNLSGVQAKPLEPGEQFRIGSLDILPFPIRHDATQPVGYLIQSAITGEKALFVTDTYRVQYTFSGLTEVAVECNYAEDSLDESSIHPEVLRRIRRNHFSLEGCKAFLEACDLSRVRRILLIHLSHERGDARRFKNEIMALTGKEVGIIYGKASQKGA